MGKINHNQKYHKVYFDGYFCCYAESPEEAEKKKPTDDCVDFVECWTTGHDECFVDDMAEEHYKIWEEKFK